LIISNTFKGESKMNKPLSLDSIDVDFFTVSQMSVDNIRDLAHAAVYWPVCDAIMEKCNQVCDSIEYMHRNREKLNIQWTQLSEVVTNAESLYLRLIDEAFLDRTLAAHKRYNDWEEKIRSRLSKIGGLCNGYLDDDFEKYPRLLVAPVTIPA
jgi:hypothetical protein